MITGGRVDIDHSQHNREPVSRVFENSCILKKGHHMYRTSHNHYQKSSGVFASAAATSSPARRGGAE